MYFVALKNYDTMTANEQLAIITEKIYGSAAAKFFRLFCQYSLDLNSSLPIN